MKIRSLSFATALTMAGQIGSRQLQLTLLLLPGVALGVATSRRYQGRIDPTVIRPTVLAICTVAALALLVETVW